MYWKEIKHLSNKWDKYGFVNETEIRVAAWIALAFSLLSIYFVIFKWNFNVGLFIVWIIWLDFMLKVFISPDFSIFWRITRLFIKGKKKIMRWSVQKRFAWSIGVVLSTFVMFCMLLLSWIIESTNPWVLSLMQQISTNITNNALIILPMNPAILACEI
jgi:hypothetical protein